jgi:hypothetical protein
VNLELVWLPANGSNKIDSHILLIAFCFLSHGLYKLADFRRYDAWKIRASAISSFGISLEQIKEKHLFRHALQVQMI